MVGDLYRGVCGQVCEVGEKGVESRDATSQLGVGGY